MSFPLTMTLIALAVPAIYYADRITQWSLRKILCEDTQAPSLTPEEEEVVVQTPTAKAA